MRRHLGSEGEHPVAAWTPRVARPMTGICFPDRARQTTRRSPRCSTRRSLLENLRRLALLTERLAARPSLSPDEAAQAKKEIQTAREGSETVETMLTARRQQLRVM